MSALQAPTSSDSTPARFRLDYGHTVAGLVLVVLGAVWLADVADVVQLRASLLLPGLLTVVGVALVVGSLTGPHPGLLTVGVLLALATIFSALSPPEAFRGGIGQRTWTVSDVAELKPSYEVGLGDLTLDLSALTIEGDRSVQVSVGAGNLVVRVPAGVPVRVEASVGAGDISLFGEKANGLSVERTINREGPATAPGQLRLDLEVGAGEIEVS